MPATKIDNGLWRYQKVMVDPLTVKKTRLRKREFKTKRDAKIAEATVMLLYSGEPELIEELPVAIVIDDFIALKQTNINARSIQDKLAG